MRQALDPAPLNRPARERILLTAHDLFYRDGIRATGIDKIISESKVAKVTFYRHFPSKNALILAFLEYRHQVWMAWLKTALHQHGSGALGVKVLPKVMGEWFNQPLFRGCAFINSVAELGGAVPDVGALCRRHKREMTTLIAGLLPPTANRLEIADAIAIAVDGAIIRAQCDLDMPGHDRSKTIASLTLAIDALLYH